ncbi:hypothetical protein SAMN05428957_106104 [Oryzisolibacter propanilivorax]|uniref:Hemerythrin HHE cation binding domain-containing protein n=1 Tax=Oryzisolibacter propanilivorax TaxID=1527607 RepID=A0A1G9TFU3_9BURK|nr:hypothetical protein [Oryzisolibacter propanilivorax]SDM46577.1 hypothetical protein SAMN05428957_106104 [Oryzisolibacter propanilivorax]
MTDSPVPVDTCAPGHFERQHECLDALLHAHLLDVVGGDFASALDRLRQWRAGLAEHIEIENTLLLPHVPEGARWAARVYLVEHDRIALLADEYQDKVRAAAQAPAAADERTRRERILALVDAAHALRHVLEHHHEREHTALAHELPAALQEAAWRDTPLGSNAPTEG